MLDRCFLFAFLIVLGGCASNAGLHPFNDYQSDVNHRDFLAHGVAPAWFWEPWEIRR